MENPTATTTMLHKANDALYEKLMDLEVSSSERYAESIPTFDVRNEFGGNARRSRREKRPVRY